MTAAPMVLMSDEEVARYGRNPDAGFGALQTARGLLPLVAMEVDARVTGVVATIELAQTFANTTGAAIEATSRCRIARRCTGSGWRSGAG
jgi:Ca-activated chloride channel family protein